MLAREGTLRFRVLKSFSLGSFTLDCASSQRHGVGDPPAAIPVKLRYLRRSRLRDKECLCPGGTALTVYRRSQPCYEREIP